MGAGMAATWAVSIPFIGMTFTSTDVMSALIFVGKNFGNAFFTGLVSTPVVALLLRLYENHKWKHYRLYIASQLFANNYELKMSVEYLSAKVSDIIEESIPEARAKKTEEILNAFIKFGELMRKINSFAGLYHFAFNKSQLDKWQNYQKLVNHEIGLLIRSQTYWFSEGSFNAIGIAMNVGLIASDVDAPDSKTNNAKYMVKKLDNINFEEIDKAYKKAYRSLL
jgi:hypothetical protein